MGQPAAGPGCGHHRVLECCWGNLSGVSWRGTACALGVDDPAHATGTEAEIEAAFTTAYRILRRRIEAFLALPLAQLAHDRTRLKAELDRIGALSA